MTLGGHTQYQAPPSRQRDNPPDANNNNNGNGNGFNTAEVAVILADVMKHTSTSRADQEVGDRANDVSRQYTNLQAQILAHRATYSFVLRREDSVGSCSSTGGSPRLSCFFSSGSAPSKMKQAFHCRTKKRKTALFWNNLAAGAMLPLR
jgi:hypothetical protein